MIRDREQFLRGTEGRGEVGGSAPPGAMPASAARLGRPHLVVSADAGDGLEARSLADTLRALPGRLTGERTTLEAILVALGERTTGFVLLVLAVPAIVPTPGIPAGMIFGTALIVLASQMAAGATSFRLPAWLARRPFRRRRLAALVGRAAPWVERLSRRTRTRWTRFVGRRAVRWLSLPVAILGVLIALPIPFGNTLPGIAVLLIALGLAERDGAMVVLGLCTAVAALAVSAGLILGGYWLAEGLLIGG